MGIDAIFSVIAFVQPSGSYLKTRKSLLNTVKTKINKAVNA